MKKLKIATIVGTRPEIIRLSAVIKKLSNSKSIEHYLVHTGQNYDYELNQIFFDDLNLKKPDYFFEINPASSIENIGNIIIQTEKFLNEIEPNAILILGDTDSCLSAIAAKRKKIPIFHMEAGNRCFDQRVPEEINRKIVDHISDINLPYSEISKNYLLREGISPQNIIKTGSPMREVIHENLKKINSSDILSELKLKKQNYFLISYHRAENVDNLKSLKVFADSINKISDYFKLPIIFSTHPRTEKMIKKHKINFGKFVKHLKPLGFFDYVYLQKNSLIVLSDSGTISEESSILNFKALNIRNNHERPEAMEEGVVMMTGLDFQSIFNCINHLLESNEVPNLVKDYEPLNVAEKVLRIILSYTNYVNRYVWKKFL